MKNLQENIVPSEHQNHKNLFDHTGGSLNLLFVGNSITLHGIKPDIGWNRECGMAASDLEHDYVHLVMRKVRTHTPDAGFAIAQVADLERNYADPAAVEAYRAIADFKPDLALFFFGANVPQSCDQSPEELEKFKKAYAALASFLSCPILHAQGFYIRPALDAVKREVAAERDELYLELGNTRTDENTHGLYNHPNDLGMEQLADTFYRAMEPILWRK